MRSGFVEASPSRVLRDGEGRFPLKLSHYSGFAGLASSAQLRVPCSGGILQLKHGIRGHTARISADEM